ncbi:thiolase family protein [Candidatus Collinsella stercoripullorum]|uniref:thiolase family protein n=1 Tax=Candidatus Collinsella stercoripullorum TaxID=2838522 RepID=UPI0022E2FF81|nr:thiolase family protein [Candidatus Collinsella stercoripullorum]
MSNKTFEKRPDDIVLVAGARTPIAKFGGSLKTLSAIDMGALVVSEAVKRAGIDPSVVDECIIGQVGSWGPNGFVARAISLKAGLPNETCAYSVNRQCGSGLQSIADGIMEIQTGQAEVVVAGGSESLSQLPYYVTDARWGARMGHKQFEDGVIDILTWPLDMSHNGVTAENVAKKFNVTREEQDAFAARSQQRACQAVADGVFVDEIVPVEIKGRKGAVTVFDTDENPREGVTAESLAKLRPCFVTDGTGTVTAANSSSLNDAAAAVVIMTRAKAEELGCAPMVAIRGFAVAGYDASLMGYSPYFSSKKLAEKLDLDLTAIDFFEINEAFASQAYAVSRDLGLDEGKVNIYGGGISLGHPIGATGTILAIKCAYELARRHTEKRDAMVSMCIGGGQGISMYFTAE